MVEELARGGMAVLYLVRARGPAGFEKHAVLKRIAPGWADDEEFVEMFLTEARLAAALQHPHAVAVYDLGEDRHGPYFVMEYIHGVDLYVLLRTVAQAEMEIPIQHVLTIGIAVAGGLHHAHAQGIVHRDVSPRNILVTYEGGVKVVDFGIAKAISRRTQTRPSVRKGKIGYMSPEQCRGDTVRAVSDVFALGVVLWELLTGRRLFRAENEFAVMNEIINHDVDPPSSLRPDIPPELDRLVLAALHRNPDERTPSARAVQAALESAAKDLALTPSATELGDFVAEVCGRRPYPWGETGPIDVGSTPRSRSEQDDIQTRAGVVPQPAPESRPRRWPLAAAGLAAAAAVTWAVWPAASAPAPEAEAAAAPVEHDPPDVTPEPKEPEPEKLAGPAPPPADKDIEEPPAEDPEPPAAEPVEDPPPERRDHKRKKRRGKSKDQGTDKAKPFDPDGVGPLRTILD